MNYIINPITNRKVYINSKLGRTILNNYIRHLKAGACALNEKTNRCRKSKVDDGNCVLSNKNRCKKKKKKQVKKSPIVKKQSPIIKKQTSDVKKKSIKCKGLRKTKDPKCKDQPNCKWVKGKGCKNKTPVKSVVVKKSPIVKKSPVVHKSVKKKSPIKKSSKEFICVNKNESKCKKVDTCDKNNDFNLRDERNNETVKSSSYLLKARDVWGQKNKKCTTKKKCQEDCRPFINDPKKLPKGLMDQALNVFEKHWFKLDEKSIKNIPIRELVASRNIKMLKNLLDNAEKKGIKELNLIISEIKKNNKLGNFVVGDHVEARYGQNKSFYKGNIVVVNKDGTYDIKYEDGDYEQNVKKEFIKLYKNEINFKEWIKNRLKIGTKYFIKCTNCMKKDDLCKCPKCYKCNLLLKDCDCYDGGWFLNEDGTPYISHTNGSFWYFNNSTKICNWCNKKYKIIYNNSFGPINGPPAFLVEGECKCSRCDLCVHLNHDDTVDDARWGSCKHPKCERCELYLNENHADWYPDSWEHMCECEKCYSCGKPTYQEDEPKDWENFCDCEKCPICELVTDDCECEECEGCDKKIVPLGKDKYDYDEDEICSCWYRCGICNKIDYYQIGKLDYYLEKNEEDGIRDTKEARKNIIDRLYIDDDDVCDCEYVDGKPSGLLLEFINDAEEEGTRDNK